MPRLTEEQEEVLEKFYRWCLLSYSPATAKRYKHAVAGFLEYYGEVPPILSPDEEVEVVVEYLERISDPRTRQVVCYAIKAFYRFLGRPDIEARIPKMRASSNPPEPLTYDFDRLRKAIMVWSDLREKAILCTSFCLALRIGEVTLLNRDEFNPRACIIVVHREKRPHGQTEAHPLPLEEWCCDILKQYLRTRRDNERALFVSYVGNEARRISQEAVRRIFKKFAQFIGKPSAHFHQLRHTRGTEFAMYTKDPIAIAKFMGHRNPASTQVYIHLAASTLADRLTIESALMKEIARIVKKAELESLGGEE